MAPTASFLSLLAALVLPLADAAPSGGRLNGIGLPIKNFAVAAENLVPNSYIVVYNETYAAKDIATHQNSIMAMISTANVGKRSLDGRSLSTKANTYTIGNFRAMSLEAEESMMMDINNHEAVKYIEQNAIFTTQALATQSQATTGLARLSHASTNGSGYYYDPSAGQGITAFVVDTGVKLDHVEFEGRAVWGANFVDSDNTDGYGHGSHVAGTIGGKTYGVAKKVSIVAVKVLDSTGRGTTDVTLQGMNWVADNATASNLKGKSVMNMSLGGPLSPAVNDAISAIRAAGVFPCVAAGNDDADAGAKSPSSAPDAFTVGAIDQTTDVKAYFSNYGPKVAVFAPGVNVLSVGIQSTTDSRLMNGTSMATPHITGLAAYLMALENITDLDALSKRITDLAQKTGAKVINDEGTTTTLIANNGHL